MHEARGIIVSLAIGLGSGCASSTSVSPPTPVAAASAEPTIGTSADQSSRYAASLAASATTSLTSANADARSTGACEDALSDHIAFYGDVDRPPPQAKQQLFMELCLALPPLFQLCASPGYQAEHEAECRPVHAATGEPSRLWSELFEALREP